MTEFKHYPYKSWIRWIVSPRQKHLTDALDRRPGAFRGTQGRELRERLHLITIWLRVRVVLIVLLSFSIVVAAITWVLRLVGSIPAGTEILAVVETINAFTTTSSGVLTVLYMLTLRTLGQLEIDAILLLPSHRSDMMAETD